MILVTIEGTMMAAVEVASIDNVSYNGAGLGGNVF